MRKVKYARFHSNVYIIGAGELGVVLPTQSKTLESLNMNVEGSFLNVEFKFHGKPYNIGVPLSNVVAMDFELEKNS